MEGLYSQLCDDCSSVGEIKINTDQEYEEV